MFKLTRKKTIVFSLLILALLLAYGVKRIFFTKGEVTYITAPVVRMDLEESVLASGTLKAYKTVAVGAQVSGQLKKLHVKLGDKVKSGQLLAEIDPVLQRNNLKDAEAQVENLQAQKRSKLASLRQYELARQRQLAMQKHEASSRADLESAQAQLDSTRGDISSLDAQIKKARIAVDTARANLGYTSISAPINGVVISIDTEEGQTVVSTQSATTILTLADLDTITVKAKISEADVIRVKPGLVTYFTLLGDTETRYYGKLRAIEPGPVSSSSTTTSSSSSSSSSSAVYYNGLFEVPNPENRLRVSMTAQVSIVLGSASKALCIPVSAIGEKKDGYVQVRVLRDNRPETRRVKTGLTNNVFVQILEGVAEGERVVVGDSSTVPAAEKSNRPGPPPGRR